MPWIDCEGNSHFLFYIKTIFPTCNEPLTRLSKQGALEVSKEYLHVHLHLKMFLCLAGRLIN